MMSLLGVERRAQRCIMHVKTRISVIAECGCEYQLLCCCLDAFPAGFGDCKKASRQLSFTHPETTTAAHHLLKVSDRAEETNVIQNLIYSNASCQTLTNLTSIIK